MTSKVSWANPSVLIVGGTSLLGIHLAATLQYSGVSVTVAERLPLLKVKVKGDFVLNSFIHIIFTFSDLS